MVETTTGELGMIGAGELDEMVAGGLPITALLFANQNQPAAVK